MLEGMTRLDNRRSRIRRLARNEETLVATTYAERLPNDLTGRQCYILDPMLASAAPCIVGAIPGQARR